jgi:hypothetical protein
LGTKQSDGLVANLVDIAASETEITPTIILENGTTTRVYVTDARTDAGQIGSLKSGQHTQSPFPSGIPYCNEDVAWCTANQYEMTLAKFSYIEPGDTLSISLKYSGLQPFPTQDDFSFSLALIARFAKPGEQSDAAAPTQVRFSFPSVPVTRK